MKPQTVLIVTRKDSGKKEAYSSVRRFVQSNPAYKLNTMYNYTSRYHKPFEDDAIILEKINFIHAPEDREK